MKISKIALAIAVFYVLIISACGFQSVKQGASVDERKANKNIVDGKTTKQEIIMEFGPPTKTMDNEKMFFYTWTEGSQSKITVYTSNTTVTKNLIIMFDNNGIVASHKITQTGAESQSGVGMGESGKK